MIDDPDQTVRKTRKRKTKKKGRKGKKSKKGTQLILDPIQEKPEISSDEEETMRKLR